EGSNNPPSAKLIVETSLRFGVLCRFTAFVAVDRTEVANREDRLHQVTQAVEMPAGWERRREGVAEPAKAPPYLAKDRDFDDDEYELALDDDFDDDDFDDDEDDLDDDDLDDEVDVDDDDDESAAPGQNQIKQLTSDHDVARALVEAGTISPEEVKQHRFR